MDDLIRAVRALEEHGSQTKAAKSLGIPRTTFRDRITRASKEGLTDDGGNLKGRFDVSQSDSDSQTISSVSHDVSTVEDALKKGEIDLDVWEVERCIINSWEVVGNKIGRQPLWQVKVWLRRKLPKPIYDAIASLTDEWRANPLKLAKPKSRGREDHLLELSLYDAHFGSLCWGLETGSGNYDLEIQESRYLDAIDDLLTRTSPFDVSRIVFPIGNDFFHMDNWAGTTAKGTPLDSVDDRFSKVFQRGCSAVVKAIMRCSEIAPVDVLWIPGNHDPATSFYMSEVAKHRFHDSDYVHVDNSPEGRKYRRWGLSLIGYTHGDKPRKHGELPMIMAMRRRKDWAECRFFHWRTGHFHTQRETFYNAGDTHGGVKVTVIGGLCSTDKWHYDQGFVGNPCVATATLWSKKYGESGVFTTYMDEDDEKWEAA